MGTVDLSELPEGALLLLDSAPIIYFLEAHPRYGQSILESWQIVPLDARIAASAARLRGSLRLKLPDAVQVASALAINAEALVTHDRDFGRVTALRVIS
jgi:predicted nucleic acid-binding protein